MSILKRPPFLLLLAGLWLLPAAVPQAGEGHGEENGHGGEAAHEEAEGPLALDERARAAAGIAVAAAAPRPLAKVLRAPAEVRPDLYRAAQVTPRIQAQVVARHARLGDAVRRGQPLVSLSSVAMAEAQAALIEADREWRRVRRLGRKVVSEKRWVAAQVARRLAYARVLAYGMTRAQIEALLKAGDARRADGSFALVAPVDGTVVHDDFVLGEVVEPGRVLYELADESRVWVEAQLSPEDAARVRPGQKARVRAADGTVLEGEVMQVHHRLSEQSRTRAVRIAAANTGDRLHPGELVEAELALGGGAPVLAVPERAVVLLQGGPAVFVLAGREPGGHWRFEPRPVRTGRSAGGWVEVRAGLKAGETVVTAGAYHLKALLLKAQLGAGHAH